MMDLRPVEGEAAARDVLRDELRKPFALCGACAVLYEAAFAIKAVGGDARRVCENCHKKRMGKLFVQVFPEAWGTSSVTPSGRDTFPKGEGRKGKG